MCVVIHAVFRGRGILEKKWAGQEGKFSPRQRDRSVSVASKEASDAGVRL